MSARRAFIDRVTAVADGAKRFEIDDHLGCRVLGDVARVGDHDRDRLADIKDFIAR